MNDPPGTSHDSLAHLIEAAGRREAPPTHAYERALAATTQAWQTKVRRRRWRIAASIAAGIATLGIGTFVSLRSLDSSKNMAEPIANVTRVIGAVTVRSADSRDWTSLREDGPAAADGRRATHRSRERRGAADRRSLRPHRRARRGRA